MGALRCVFWVNLLLAALVPTTARTLEIVLNRSDETADWWIHPGWEFPGAIDSQIKNVVNSELWTCV